MKLTYTVFTKKHLFTGWSFRNDSWQINEMYFQTHVNCENYQNQFPIEWMACGVKNVYTGVWRVNKTLLEVQAYHVKSIPNPLFLKYIIFFFLYLGSSEKDEQSKFKTFQWWNYTKNRWWRPSWIGLYSCTVKLWFVLQTPFSLNNFCLILVNFGYRDFIYDKIDLSVIRAGYCTRIARI